jgi:hypothetical protein
MADEPQNWTPYASAGPQPRRKGVRIRALRRAGDEVVAGMIKRGGWAFEIQIYQNWQILLGQMFMSREAAERFAAERREEFERGGWTEQPPKTI